MADGAKVALVTGAGSGIGKAAALRLARDGLRIVALSHNDEEVAKAVREIEEQGGEALGVTADISDADQMRQAVQQIEERFGRLDVVFSNAGINGVWAPIDEIQPDEWDRTMNTNLRGTYLTIHFAVPLMKRTGGGSILITSSINGTRVFSNAGATAYSSTKAAQVAMGQMLALELAKHQIRVNVICPGKIETNINDNTEKRDLEEAAQPAEYPEGRIPLTKGQGAEAEEVAELVAFLSSDKARFISGTPIWIDGGQSVLVG
ncbi:SDR family oxidoreductase [Phenylobacterium deserti]|uniref:D-xylose 1-dehydrogenase n=1 Tax=Phenylobacterium deserti TaxID=1914756 RepID=A0A328AQE3_9CAUL|nr:SDR family NAD(P)-dependent oxidoreductase [Phenylobacterium deserti]RAK57220.1 3-oxoacyl-[acyl-carrier-protein] reductase [Phenylobacterium deserti]